MSADIVYLDTFRQCRHLPPTRPEALLPPIGKRRGDPVENARGRRGTVISYATRAIFGRGIGVVLAIQFPDTVAVIPADDVEPVSGPVVDETPPAAATAAPAETEA